MYLIIFAIILIILLVVWIYKPYLFNSQQASSTSIHQSEVETVILHTDYTELENLLAAGKWKEADYETYRLIFEVVKSARTREDDTSKIKLREIYSFPCNDLLKIDELWIKYSQGKFGFTVQKYIYDQNNYTGITKQEKWNLFIDSVGWNSNQSVEIDSTIILLPAWVNEEKDQRIFDLSAPIGHLPSVIFGTFVKDFWLYNQRGGVVDDFFYRLEFCALPGDLQQARILLEQAIDKEQTGDLESALTDLDQSIKLDPRYAKTYAARGILYYKLHSFAAAINDLDQAIILDNNCFEAYNTRSIIRRLSGDLDGAIVDINRGLNINPKDAIMYSSRGTIYLNIGDYKRAINDFDQAIALNRNLGQPYFNRGLAKEAMGNLQGAMADFQAAANLYEQQGNYQLYQDAMKRLRKIQEELN